VIRTSNQEARVTRCSVCDHAERPQVDALLTSGTSVRSVAQMFGIPRTTLGRHKAHAHELPRRFALIRGQDGPDGQADPLSEAIGLAARARTPREKLRGLEQVRAATKLKLRGVELDPEARALLDRNIAEAEAAYKAAGDFETQARALSGWRESLLHRLEAVETADAIHTRLVVTYPGSDPETEGTPIAMRPGDYWSQVPARLRDPDRFRVERTIRLRYAVVSHGDRPDVEVRVRDRDGVLVWANERPATGTGGDQCSTDRPGTGSRPRPFPSTRRST
jgi:hypothetical protein